MCLQDLYIARHTYARYVGVGNPDALTFPGNPRRMGLLFTNPYYMQIRDQNNVEIVNYRAILTSLSSNSTITNNAIPTANTAATISGTNEYNGQGFLFHIRDYGAIVQEQLIVAYSNTNPDVWELLMDVELERALTKIEEQWK